MNLGITGGTRRPAGRRLRREAIRAVTAAVIVAGFLGGTIVIDGGSVNVANNVAFAKGGNGGGGGKGDGGRGNGNKGDHGDVAGIGQGRGHAKGHGRVGRNGDDDDRSDPPGAPSLGDESATENGISAAALGSLNASHASSTARKNASPNSMVGQIAAFADAVESENVDAAAEALTAKANKAITEPVVTEVARRAQIEVSEETARAIAESAAAIQAGESEEPVTASMPSGS